MLSLLKRPFFYFFSFLLLLNSCQPDFSLTDEEIGELIVGTWDYSMIISTKGSKTLEGDSAFFHADGRQKQLSFSAKGVYYENGAFLSTDPYLILDGDVYLMKGKDTMIQEVAYLNNNTLVLMDEEESKRYYEKFSY